MQGSEKIIYYEYDPSNPPKLTEKGRAEMERLAAMSDEDIDYSDIPDLGDRTDWYRPGPLGAPRPAKVAARVNYDADVLAWFKSQGRGYQARMNHALRRFMDANRDADLSGPPAGE